MDISKLSVCQRLELQALVCNSFRLSIATGFAIKEVHALADVLKNQKSNNKCMALAWQIIHLYPGTLSNDCPLWIKKKKKTTKTAWHATGCGFLNTFRFMCNTAGFFLT